MICSVEGCDRPVLARGWCRGHYQRWSRHGDVCAEVPFVPTPLERLNQRTVRQPNGCWIWTGSTTEKGYGHIRIGTLQYVHRVGYEQLVGPIPDGMELDHVRDRGCTSRACWNPEHLEPVTHKVNTLRSDAFPAVNARKTHCPEGHPYDMVDSRGGRRCRACYQRRKAESNARAMSAVSAKGARRPREMRDVGGTDGADAGDRADGTTGDTTATGAGAR